MRRKYGKFLALFSLLSFSGMFLALFYLVDRWYLLQTFHTFLGITILYVIFKIVLESVVTVKLKDYRFRYNARKAVSILFLLVSAGLVITLWIEHTEAVFLAYGLIAAGIAISLQDFFKGFIGGLLILTNIIYRVGDRVRIGETHGDVMDIGMFYTTLMETRNWVKADQATGRIVMLPNAMVLTNPVYNYTKDHSFLWDEITIPLTYDSNWESMIGPIMRILEKESSALTDKAEREIARIGEKYYLPKKDVEPMVYVDMDGSWINLHVRFVTEAKHRRNISDRLHRLILAEAAGHEDVKIAQAQIESWKLGEGPRPPDQP